MDKPFWAFLLLLSYTYTAAVADDPTSDSKGWGDVAPVPSENECRTFIEAALKEQRSQVEAAPDVEEQKEDGGTTSEADIDSANQVTEEAADEASSTEDVENRENDEIEKGDGNESTDASSEETVATDDEEQEGIDPTSAEAVDLKDDETPTESASDEEAENAERAEGEIDASEEKHDASEETDASGEKEASDEVTGADEDKSVEEGIEVEAAESSETEEATDVEVEGESKEEAGSAERTEEETVNDEETSTEDIEENLTNEQLEQSSQEESVEEDNATGDIKEETDNQDETSVEDTEENVEPTADDKSDSNEETTVNDANEEQSNEENEQSEEQEKVDKAEEANEEGSSEVSGESETIESEMTEPPAEGMPEENQYESSSNEESQAESSAEEVSSSKPADIQADAASLNQEETPASQNEPEEAAAAEEGNAEDDEEEEESPEQEDLTLKIEIPDNLRPRDHIFQVLRLDSESVDSETKLLKAEETTLKDLKRLYEAAIKPLEILYKYRDLSNRHFGDPEIFSKPLILFMGPWSGGKSTIINYLLDNEYKNTALRTGAEPSPAYFNIVMWGEREEIMDGTQLAADWTFSGLQKFGQGLLDRLRGLKMNHPLLEKVNIVEIPGILEIRKQVERLFPLNDACQWFIDRADIIFLVYDPSKLDVGPETEAILDQLKGREYQTKIILNKADQVKPEELMRVQGTLIWNISPLMSSTEPPVMYSTSLWSHPYQSGSPSRLLFAQEKAFLKDLREAVDKRVENKISSARRFAVRVRNHAKMVDCYLTTFYNHKTFFGNKQTVSNDIIEHPQNYHIYEGLSTLTNISRYDLPDPDVYKDFFRLNPVYDFQQLSSTCTYFRGCPINRLDVAIAYDLPELVGKYKKIAEDIVKSSGGGKK